MSPSRSSLPEMKKPVPNADQQHPSALASQDPPPISNTNTTTTSPPPTRKANTQEAKRIASLQAKIAALQVQIQETEEKQKEVDAKLKNKDTQATVKAHIKLLHDYNEIRDVGQGLMGIIANTKGIRVRDVYEDFGVGEGD